MHIGFLTSEFPHRQNPNRVGGIGTSIKNLVDEFTLQGHTVTIFLYGQSEDVLYTEGLLNVVFIKGTKAKFLNWLWLRKKLEKIINYHVEHKYLDIVEAADWSGITAFMDLKCKTVVRLHGSDTYFCSLENRKQKYKNYLLEKIALKSADSVVSVSAFTADKTLKLFDLNIKIDVIHNGIDLKTFVHTKKDLNKRRNILYFGTLNRKKGVLEIPKIAEIVKKNLPDSRFIFIGNDSVDPIEKISTWRLIQEMSGSDLLDNLEYTGAVPYSEMREAILEAGVCIFPSYAEAFPVSWLEAMACSKPVVSSDIGWSNEVIVDNESGLLCAPNDHKKYADLILKVLNDQNYAKQLGDNARQRIETHFSATVIAKQNIDYYAKLVDKGYR